MVVRKNVREAIFGPVHWQIRSDASLIPADVFEAIELLREAEIRIGSHTPVMLGEILQLDGPPAWDFPKYLERLHYHIEGLLSLTKYQLARLRGRDHPAHGGSRAELCPSSRTLRSAFLSFA